jgi:hypothetical protein
MFKLKQLGIALMMAGAIVSCKKDDGDRPDLVIPEVYDGTAFTANAATELLVRKQLADITKEAQRGRVNGTTLEYATLTALLNAGSPSLKAVGTNYYMTKMDGIGGWLDEMAKSSGGTYLPGTPVGEGGTFGPYLFDENGLEIEQVMEKGMFGAVLFHHAVNVMSAPIDASTSDKVLAIFGSNPSFPNSNTSANHDFPDTQFAIYAARRTDENNPNGLYFQMQKALIKLQAAAKAGAEYNKEQQDAVKDIILIWEKVNAATIINYALSSISLLSNSEPTDAQKSAALHSIAEGVGFMHGFKTVPSKKITDTQIDQVIALLNAPAIGTPQLYKFVTSSVTELPKLQQVITNLKEIYGFTDAEIETFRNNWVSLQSR